jgi:hypothetical protein
MTHQHQLLEYTHPQSQQGVVFQDVSDASHSPPDAAHFTYMPGNCMKLCLYGHYCFPKQTCPVMLERKSYKLYAILNDYPYFKNSETSLLLGITSEFPFTSFTALSWYSTFV